MSPQNFLKIILRFGIAIILFLISFTMVPVSIVIFCALRTFVCILALLLRKNLKHRMTMVSSLWACGEDITTKPKINNCLYFVFDGHIDLEKFQEAFEQRVIKKQKTNGELMYPELKMYWATFLNYLFWKEDIDFDLKNHVRLYDYKEPDLTIPQEFCDENVLRQIWGPLMGKPYKARRSPWEALLVQNFKSSEIPPDSRGLNNNKQSTVLIFRIHHGLADGYTNLKIIIRDLMLSPVNTNSNFPKMGKLERIGFNACLPFKLSWDMAAEITNSFDGGNCWSCWWKKEKLSGKVLTSISRPIDTQLIKKVKNKYGVGYNDVLCAITATVSQRLMIEAGQKIPREISCSTPFPLAGHPDGLVNHMSWHIFKWPMDANLKREDRLSIISRRLNQSKYYTGPFGFNLLAKYCNFLPTFLLRLIRMLPLTMTWSSFPYPSGQSEFQGFQVKLTDVVASVGPGDGTAGTGIALISYNGRQRIIVNIDKIYFPNDRILGNFEQYANEEIQAYLNNYNTREI